MAALQQYAPGAIQAIAGLTPGTAQQIAAGDVAVAPAYNELYRTGQLASANTEADIAAGPGQRLVSSADTAQKTLDPEYYAQRGLLSNAMSKYLTSYDPSSLTPTEEAQISRGIGATGGSVTPSSMQTIRNAQTFGDKGTQRWQNFGQAVTNASTALPSLKSGINGFNVATQRGTNPGGSGFANVGSSAANTNFGFANSALGNVSATQRNTDTINAENSPIALGTKAVGAY
jgi:hypothetical protein